MSEHTGKLNLGMNIEEQEKIKLQIQMLKSFFGEEMKTRAQATQILQALEKDLATIDYRDFVEFIEEILTDKGQEDYLKFVKMSLKNKKKEKKVNKLPEKEN